MESILMKRGIITSPGMYSGWVIDVVDDVDASGGYYLLRYTKNKEEGFDDWFLTEEQLYNQIEFERLIIVWD